MNFVFAHGEVVNAPHHILEKLVAWFVNLDLVWKVILSLILLGLISFFVWFMINDSQE